MESLSGKRKEIQRFQHLNANISFLALRQGKHAVTSPPVLLWGQVCLGVCVCLGLAIVFLRFV